jgi:hypothetical protein
MDYAPSVWNNGGCAITPLYNAAWSIRWTSEAILREPHISGQS